MPQTLQTGYRSTLSAKLNAADSTITVATAPTVTQGRMHIYKGATHAWVKYTGVTGNTLTGVTFVSQTADPTTTVSGTSFSAGTPIELVEMHDQMIDKQSGSKVKIYTNTTARDADITSPENGMTCYVEVDGVFNDHIAGAWTQRATGSTPNASTTVAGKVEIATTAESIAGTDTGGSGASLSVLPSDIAKNIQSASFTYGADVGGDDAYVVALTPTLTTYTTGQTLTMKVTTANTGACTVDFGPGVKNIKMPDGSNPGNGTISGIVSLMYDGTNFVLQNQDLFVRHGTYTTATATRTGSAGTTDGTSTGILGKATIGSFIWNNSDANATTKLQFSSDNVSFSDYLSFGDTTGVNEYTSVPLSAGYAYRVRVVTNSVGVTGTGTIRYTV